MLCENSNGFLKGKSTWFDSGILLQTITNCKSDGAAGVLRSESAPKKTQPTRSRFWILPQDNHVLKKWYNLKIATFSCLYVDTLGDSNPIWKCTDDL